MDKIVVCLKTIITREGQDYLEDHPWEVYEELKKAKAGKKDDLALVLMTLALGMPTAAKKDADKLPAKLKKVGLDQKTVEKLVGLYEELYSKDNEAEWQNQDRAGLRAFLENGWGFSWDGEMNWEYSGGYLPCYYSCEAELQVTELVDSKLDSMLKKNPFMTEEQIADYYRGELEGYLNSKLDWYVTADDYYEPVMEDFEAEHYIKKWAEGHGFELVSFEGSGDTGEYETRGRWY